MTSSAFAPLTHAQQIFKDLVWDVSVKAGEIYLEGVVPALNLPVLKQAEEGVVQVISDALFNQLILFIDITAIKLVNSAHQSAYDRASIELAVIAQDKGIESDEFKKARDVAKAALSQFTYLPH